MQSLDGIGRKIWVWVDDGTSYYDPNSAEWGTYTDDGVFTVGPPRVGDTP